MSVEIIEVQDHFQLSLAEYTQMIRQGYRSEISELNKISSQAIELVAQYPLLWGGLFYIHYRDAEKIQVWARIAIEIFEETGFLYSIKDLVGWWIDIKNEYAQAYENLKLLGAEPTMPHYDQLHFLNQMLDDGEEDELDIRL